MALDDPLQWVVIAVVAVVFLMYGPKKIPEFARSLGIARKEYNQASASTPPVSTKSQSPPQKPDNSAAPVAGDPIIDAARKLNIPTAGKTREEISTELVARLRA